jgi:antitoxin component YwqK of YwqJK toxin-antitoxin module
MDNVELFDEHGDLKQEYAIPYVKSYFTDETLLEAYSKEFLISYSFPEIRTRNINGEICHHKVYTNFVLTEEYYTKMVNSISDSMIGSYKSWYENGQLELDEAYDDSGRLSGLIQKYYDNGQREYAALCENDAYKGEYKEWNRKGELIKFEYRTGGGEFTIETAKQMYRQYYRALPNFI